MIRYILDQSETNDYTHEDVYRVLADIIASDNLAHFIEKMKAFAGPQLLKALEEIDLRGLQIRTAEDLIRYLVGVADKYGFDPSEIWDALLRMALNEPELAGPANINLADEFTRSRFKRGVRITAGIIILEGLIIFFLILFARRKKKKENAGEELKP